MSYKNFIFSSLSSCVGTVFGYSTCMETKYTVIAALEKTLKAIEKDHCFALREGNREAAREFYEERGEVIWKLQNVK